MDKYIYILRHGQTDYNKLGIVQGSGVDSDLNDIGRLQAKQVYDHYNTKVQFDLLIHSGLKRTKQTAHPFIESGLSSFSDPRINEMSWGIYEGIKGTPESHANYLQMIKDWGEGDYNAKVPQGESAQDLYDRLFSFINDLKQREEQHILICSHGRAIRCLICILRGQHLKEMETYKLSNTGMYIFQQVDSNFRILVQNDLSHRGAKPI